MTVTVDDLGTVADRLLEALDTYDRFAEERPYECGAVPDEVERLVTGQKHDGTNVTPGVALATVVKDRYYEACEAQAKYVEYARDQGRSDWSRIIEETEPVRKAIRRVHTAGYGIDPETDEPGYLLPHEQCPAQIVSMNTGSSPVTFKDRVIQYRTFADHFGFSPELVYHPGSGHDVSLSEAFPESRVLYVDIDEAAMVDLDRSGYEAVGDDATTYKLKKEADVILFRNAGLIEEHIVEENLRAGGWVLANDHLESATHLEKLDSLELVGVVPDDWAGDSPTVDTTDLDSYLSRIQTREEYRRLRPEEYNQRLKSIDDTVGSAEELSGGSSEIEPKRRQSTEDSQPSLRFKKGTALDIYVFRNNA